MMIHAHESCKCKLTVPRNSNFATWSSILKTWKGQLSRLKSSALSFETEKERTFCVISFSHVELEATARFFFTGTNSAEAVFAFLLEWYAHVYTRAGKSFLLRCFLAPCQLQPKVLCVFNQGNYAVFEVLIQKIKYNQE